MVRFVKAALFGLLLAIGFTMWSFAPEVVSAYSDRSTIDEVEIVSAAKVLQFDALEPSPYVISDAPDTAHESINVDYVESETEYKYVKMSDGEASLRGRVSIPARRNFYSFDPGGFENHFVDDDLLGSGSSDVSNDGDDPDSDIEPLVISEAYGSIVRIERHTSYGVGVLDVAVAPDGTWAVSGLPGGRYRVRAWMPGSFTTVQAQVLFLEQDGSANLDFVLSGVNSKVGVIFTDAGTMYEGLAGSAAAVVYRKTIDNEGLIVEDPLYSVWAYAHTVGGIALDSKPYKTTGHDGVVTWRLRCEYANDNNFLQVVVDGETFSHPLPACLDNPEN